MIDRDVVTLFEDLKLRYPMAAAGLIEQLCSNLSLMLESNYRDDTAIAAACETIAACFRPMDRTGLPDSYPWDATYAVFGRWLMRGLPQYVDVLYKITEWTEDQAALCRTQYIDMVRINRDDWSKAAEMLDRHDSDNNGMHAKPSIDRF